MRKVSIRLLKYMFPVRFLSDVIKLAEKYDAKAMGVFSARTRTGIPITRINMYVNNCNEELARKVEEEVIKLLIDHGMKPNILKGVRCEEVNEVEREEREEKE